MVKKSAFELLLRTHDDMKESGYEDGIGNLPTGGLGGSSLLIPGVTSVILAPPGVTSLILSSPSSAGGFLPSGHRAPIMISVGERAGSTGGMLGPYSRARVCRYSSTLE